MKYLYLIPYFLSLWRISSFLGVGLTKRLKAERHLCLPYTLDIEPTVRCNLRCRMCQVSDWGRAKEDMSLSQFKCIIDKFPHLIKIKLQGMGEPLLNKDFFRMVDYANRRKILVVTTTNGTLLNKDRCRDIIDSNLYAINISVDSGIPSQYKEMRGIDLMGVLDNISRLVKMRAKRRYPYISIWTVAMRSYLSGLVNLVEECAAIKVDRLVLQHSLGYWAKPEWEERLKRERLCVDKEGFILQAKDRARELGLTFINYRGNIFSRLNACPWPWHSFYITVDGFVQPCCIATDPRVFNMGNIYEDRPEDIWNNKEYRGLRKAIKNLTLHQICKGCYRV